MKIETTLNLNNAIKRTIITTASQTRQSNSQIVILCMKKTMINRRFLVRYNHAIEYQKKNSAEEWNRFHIILFEREYEYFLDMRKFCKRSVSFLVALSVKLYIDQVIAELTNLKNITSDNYHFLSYIQIENTSNSVVTWKIYWDLPKKGILLPKE